MRLLLLALISVAFVSTAFATNHDTYPMDFWRVQNHCTEPVVVTITNEKGQIELEKTLLGGEIYTQKMPYTRTQGDALRKNRVSAFRRNNHISIDHYIGGEWKNLVGTISIHVPYFYYNKDLEKSGCMN